MNPEAQEALKTILAKEPASLSYEDRAFLRARRSYLNKAQLEEYKDILNTKESAPVEESNVVEVPYNELLQTAKDLGYRGSRLKRPALEEFIATNQTQKNPFN